MKIIEIDEDLYQYIASNTRSIGESASDILRRLLNINNQISTPEVVEPTHSVDLPQQEKLDFEKPDNAENLTHSANTEANHSEQSTSSIQLSHQVQALLNSESFQQETKTVIRFLSILTVLYRNNPEAFAQATEAQQGRTRIYFARDEATLLAAGNHTKPKQIPGTPYWVITNTNSERKMLMLKGTMLSMDLPESLIDEVKPFFHNN